MKHMSMTAVALAAAIAIGIPLSGAVAEEKLDPREAFNRELNDCAQLDNPDRRQQCRDQATQRFEQAQKSGMKEGGMEKQEQKQKQY